MQKAEIEMHKVSILVPIYKAEKHIEKCARSLFAQTYSDLEFVFVDDCTPDASVDVLLLVLENYPERKGQTKLIRNERNRGAAGSKNIAIDNAMGEFVCFVDAIKQEAYLNGMDAVRKTRTYKTGKVVLKPLRFFKKLKTRDVLV